MPRKTGIKIFNGTGKLAYSWYLAKREVSRRRKGGHRLMITFPFDGSI